LAYTAVHTSYEPDSVSSATITEPLTDTVYEVLHAFTGGADGANSYSSLIQADDGNLYGTTADGGGSISCSSASGCGTVFRVNPDGNPGGTGYKVLHSFDGGADGAHPWASLFQASDGHLYGTTGSGGGPGCDGNGCGTLFRMSLDGTDYAIVHAFNGGTDGASPVAAVIQASDGLLYGTTVTGGATCEQVGCGTIFRIAIDGTGYTVLHSFTPNDGVYPQASVIQASDGLLYGTTSYLGLDGASRCNYPSFAECGTVYQMSLDGAEFNVRHRFAGIADGQLSFAALIEASDGLLYGTTLYGGTIGRCAAFTGCGTVFRISPDGTDYIVYPFTSRDVGDMPQAALLEAADGSLYSTTASGGSAGAGSIFRLAGGRLMLVRSFNGSEEGASPTAALIQLANGRFYGTTSIGGRGRPGLGVVFRLTLRE